MTEIDLVRVTRGVWRSKDEVVDTKARCAALLSAAPDGSVVAGVTAAELHGLWLPPHLPGARVDVIVRRHAQVPRAHSRSERPEIRARRRYLREDEVQVMDGVAVTSPARTWLDLGEVLRVPDLVAAGDSVLRGGVVDIELRDVIARAAHRPGVRAARTALPLLDRRSRSRPESLLRVGIVMAGLPCPAVNVAINDDNGQWLAEPDLSYDDARLAIEYNGADHADPARMRRDITRELDMLARAGWRTLTLGPAQVFSRLDQTVQLVRQFRSQRLRALSGREHA